MVVIGVVYIGGTKGGSLITFMLCDNTCDIYKSGYVKHLFMCHCNHNMDMSSSSSLVNIERMQSYLIIMKS